MHQLSKYSNTKRLNIPGLEISNHSFLKFKTKDKIKAKYKVIRFKIEFPADLKAETRSCFVAEVSRWYAESN